MQHIYYPGFDDTQTKEQDLQIFGINTYQELCQILGENHVKNFDEYNKLRSIYININTQNQQSHHPKNIQDFFEKPNKNTIQEIYNMKLHHNDKYLSTISDLEYNKIDELTIDHINFLRAGTVAQQTIIMKDIIGKISDQIYILQENIKDLTIQQKYQNTYIIHLMTWISHCMMFLDLGSGVQEHMNDEAYNTLQDLISAQQTQYNDFIISLITDPHQAGGIDGETKSKIIEKLESYQSLMIQQYHELIIYIYQQGVVMLNILPNLLISMIQNQYVIEILQESLDI